jgi:hypothetical protein
VRLEHERLDALLPELVVAPGERAQVLDPGDLEPDEVGRVVDDALRVGLGESNADARGKGVAVDAQTLRLTCIAKTLCSA